jgi:helix-turn-helix protein
MSISEDEEKQAQRIAELVIRSLPHYSSQTVYAEYLTPKAASKMTSIPVRSLENWRGRSEGPPFVRIGQLIRYRTDDLRAWMADDHETPLKAHGAPE